MSQAIGCHVCDRIVIITPRGGRLRSHKRWHSSANGMTLVTCPGSGQLPVVFPLVPGMAPSPAAAPSPEPPPPTIVFRCKVSPGRIIDVELPIDLSVDEMRRLCAFLMTQADDEETERASGEHASELTGEQLSQRISQLNRLSPSATNEHPDGCHTAEPGELRDCESDGHYSCRTCSRRVERDQ